MSRFAPNVLIVAFLSCCAGCQTKMIQPGLYLAEDDSRGIALREDGTGWMVRLDNSRSKVSLKPLSWYQTEGQLELIIESSDGFPCPVASRIRNVTAESYQDLPAPDAAFPEVGLTWRHWSRVPTSLSESWCPGMFHTESAWRTNSPAFIDSIADGVTIHLVERLRVVDPETGREKQWLQAMQIWVYVDSFSSIHYAIMGFDRNGQHRTGFADVVPVVNETRNLTTPTESIGEIVSRNVVFDPNGGHLRSEEPWQASLTVMLDQEGHVKIQNWPVSHIALSKIWYEFLSATSSAVEQASGKILGPGPNGATLSPEPRP